MAGWLPWVSSPPFSHFLLPCPDSLNPGFPRTEQYRSPPGRGILRPAPGEFWQRAMGVTGTGLVWLSEG